MIQWSGEDGPKKETRLALRPAEAAQALGISPRMLWSLTNDEVADPIPAVRKGRLVLYPVHTLRAWLDRQLQNPSKEGGDGEHRT